MGEGFRVRVTQALLDRLAGRRPAGGGAARPAGGGGGGGGRRGRPRGRLSRWGTPRCRRP